MSRTDMDLSGEERQRLAALADVMLPSTDSMPAASEADASGVGLRMVLEARPDLFEALERSLATLDPTTFDLDELSRLLEADEEAYVALTTVVAASYYSSPVVRDRIGYPGQVAKTYDPYAFVEWVNEGLLDPVVSRGAMWRDPGSESATHETRER